MCATTMISITIKRIALIVWLLENVDKEVSILQATRAAGVLNYHAVHSAFRDLASGGYLRVTRTKRYQVANAPDLVRQIALMLPLRLKSSVGLFLGGDMFEKMRRLSSAEPDIVFTLFAGAELLSPYVRTNTVHAYIPQKSVDSTRNILLSSGGRRAAVGEADTLLLPTEHRFIFEFARKRDSFKIAPMGLLLADLESYGGLGQEQANRIMQEWLSGRGLP